MKELGTRRGAEGERGTGEEREEGGRERLYLLVHSLNGFNSQTDPEAWASTQLSLVWLGSKHFDSFWLLFQMLVSSQDSNQSYYSYSLKLLHHHTTPGHILLNKCVYIDKILLCNFIFYIGISHNLKGF